MRFPLVLLYHIVLTPPANADEEERKLFLDPTRFQVQMDDLHSRGYRTLTLREYRAALAAGYPAPGRFLLKFDDASAHVHAAATPSPNQAGLPA